MKLISNLLFLLFMVALLTISAACVPTKQTVASPNELAVYSVQPIEGNSGKYMSPYTSDGVLAEWVDKSINARMGAAVGATAGAYAGQQILEDIPFVGGLLGKEVGETMGREIALKSAGGEEFIKESSDLSFNDLEDLSVYLYVNYSHTKHYADALEATKAIYPELADSYDQHLYTASAQVSP